jgi:hypothetical protein
VNQRVLEQLLQFALVAESFTKFVKVEPEAAATHG